MEREKDFPKPNWSRREPKAKEKGSILAISKQKTMLPNKNADKEKM